MNIFSVRFRNFLHTQSTHIDKASQDLMHNNDELSQLLKNWFLLNNQCIIDKKIQEKIEQEIKQEKLHLYQSNWDNSIPAPRVVYEKIFALIEFVKEKKVKFQLEIINNNEVIFSVGNLFNHKFTIFSDPMVELHNALKIPLINGSQYLDIGSNVGKKQILQFMQDNVKLTINNEKKRGFDITGVTEGNQERLGIEEFSSEILNNLSEDKELLHTYIRAKMKCFDYFSNIISSLTEFQQQSFIANEEEQDIAMKLKLHFNNMRNETENFLSYQLKQNPTIFAEYYNIIMDK
ncbi:MAG TPA: hypothetical protein ACHBZ9_16785 [Arsenophonus nasoniae]|uniref:hypothetical protein n=1 Tax=Arsenophonus nasoniae TaxID=638 RepID=UPI00387A4596